MLTTPAAAKLSSSSLDEAGCALLLFFEVSPAEVPAEPVAAALTASLIPSPFALTAPLDREASLATLASACTADVGVTFFLLPPGCLPPESTFLDPLPPTLGILQDHDEIELKCFKDLEGGRRPGTCILEHIPRTNFGGV